MNIKDIVHDLGDVLHTILGASAIDPATKADLRSKIDNAKKSAAQLTGDVVTTTEAAVEDAPALGGAVAGAVAQEAASKVPGVGSALAPTVAMIAQAAASYALSHFLASLEAHNGDHIAAAEATLASLTGGTVRDVEAKGEPLNPPTGDA